MLGLLLFVSSIFSFSQDKAEKREGNGGNQNRYYVVEQEGNQGIVDKTGKLVIPCEYDNVIDVFGGMAIVENIGKKGLVDLKTGKEVDVYSPYFVKSGGLARVKKNGKWGYINIGGKEVTSFIYDDAISFRDGFARVEKNGKWGYINTEGKETIPLIYDYADECFREGLASVKKNGKWGYINTEGKEVVPCIYDSPIYTMKR